MRGFRIESGEVLSIMKKFKEINDIYLDVDKDNLIAYYTTNDDLNIGDVKEALNLELPYYMIPSIFIELDEIPLNANGKINKFALDDIVHKDNVLRCEFRGLADDVGDQGLDIIFPADNNNVIGEFLHFSDPPYGTVSVFADSGRDEADHGGQEQHAEQDEDHQQSPALPGGGNIVCIAPAENNIDVVPEQDVQKTFLSSRPDLHHPVNETEQGVDRDAGQYHGHPGAGYKSFQL